MAEVLSLTTPISTAARTTYQVVALSLDLEAASIQAVLKGSDGIKITISWDGAQATSLMISLNKANLTSNSLQRRVITQALTDGKLPAGTVTGSPD